MKVTCHHCQSVVTPRRVRAYGATAVVLFLVVFTGIFIFWPAFFLIWLPFILYSDRHSCPVCWLRLD